jgi:autotransporter-associated beta strand protein
LQFDYPLSLASPPSAYQSAAITNLFYWNNILHDVHDRFGFTEASGNFQQTNFSGQGVGGDPVQADAQDGAGFNNANFATPPDGFAPRMQQFIWTAANPDRDSDLDNGVILHEYGHGVSNRLTGGPSNSGALNATQSGGMGEGWSDWWAITVTQKPTDTKDGAYPVGTYLIGQPPTGGGIRRYPYSFNMSTDPLTFAHYNDDAAKQVHRTGEIWCSTLWDMNWLLIDKYGFDPNLYTGYTPTGPGSAGNKLALRLVMDGLKLQPANPSFIDARNAILSADVALTGGANQREIWTAFARRQLGFGASTANSGSGTVALATDLPPAMANPGVIAQSPVGVTNTAPSTIDFTFSEPMNESSFDGNLDIVSFTDPNNANILDQITGSTWLNNVTLRVSFNTQTVQGQYTIVLGPNVLAADNGSALDQNTNGTAGEVVNDRFAASFRYDAVPLQVSSTSPINSSAVSLPFTAIDLNLNEPYAPGSIGIDDLQLTSGLVTGFSLLDADTVRYTLHGVIDAPVLTINVKYGAVSDQYGFPVQAYAGSFSIGEITAIPVSTPLLALPPLGSLVYESLDHGLINVSGDQDSFTVQLDAGDRVTILATPDAHLQPAIQLRNAANSVVAEKMASQSGQQATIQTVEVDDSGVYTVTVSGANTTTGAYSLRLLLNTRLESESNGGAANNSLGTAEILDSAFRDLSETAQVASVHGKTDRNLAPLANEVEPNNTYGTANDADANFASYSGDLFHLGVTGTIESASDTDYFNIGTLQAGDVLTIADAGLPTWRGSLQDPYIELYRAGSSEILEFDDDDGPGTDALIHRFAVTVTDTYYVRATKWSTFTGTYQLALFLENSGATPSTGGSLISETESNDSIATANDASSSWRAIQYLSRTAGTITAGDQDTFGFQFNTGDLITINIDSTSSLNARVALFDSDGLSVAFENGGSVGPGNDSSVYAFIIPATGRYYVQILSASGTGTYNADIYWSSSFTPPPVAVGSDLFAFTLAANQSVTLALEGVGTGSEGNLDLTLLNSSGVAQATGVTDRTNVDEWIANFTAESAGTYYARVTGDRFIDYSVVVGRSATFDAEPNNASITAQPIGPGLQALGYVGADDDWYEFSASVCDLVQLATSMPGGGPHEFVNNLDPSLELYAPAGGLVANDDNSGTDGRNALITYRVLAGGTYRVRVSGVASSGEYVLSLSRESCNLHVTAASLVNSSPVDGEQVFGVIGYDTTVLPESASYDIEFELDGVPISLTGIMSGAGVAAGGWSYQVGGWIVAPGSHTLTITVDPWNAVPESDETDNVGIVEFSAAAPATLPQPFTATVPQLSPLGVVNYVDVDPRIGTVLDYRGGDFAYDGHNGLDITAANFTQMDAGIPIYAAAEGTVSVVQDGNFDRQTSASGQPANLIEIDHGGGWKTAYYHLLANSITVQPGQYVAAHQLLGLMGSSGNSTDAHLHFGLHHNGFLVEPFENIAGYFSAPLPVYQGDQAPLVQDSGVTNYDVASDLAERPSSKTTFETSESSAVTYWHRITHLNAGDDLRVRWYRPDGGLQTEYSYEAADNLRHVGQYWLLDASVWSLHLGTWQVAVFVNGVELARSTFGVVSPGFGVPELLVREQGGRLIPDGRTSPVDFGSASLGTTAPQRSFAMTNHGAASVSLSGIELPPGFSLVTSLPASLAAGASTSITVQMDTVVPGAKFGVVRIASSDTDEAVYEFNVSGSVNGSASAGTPAIALPGAALAYQAGLPPVAIDPLATLSDSDSSVFDGGHVQVEFASGGRLGDSLTLLHQGTGAGQLGVSGTTVTFGGSPIGTITFGNNSIPLTVLLNSNASVAAVEAILRAVAYSNITTLSASPRYVRYTVVDETGKVSNQSIAVVVTDVVPVTTSSVFVDSNGNLVLADIHPAAKDNQFSVVASATGLVLEDANGWFSPGEAAEIPGAVLSGGNRTLSIPFASFAGSVVVHGSGGDDSVTLGIAAGATSFSKPVMIDGELGADVITVAAEITAGAAGDIVLTGELTQLGANLNTDGGNVTLAGNAVLTVGGITIDTEQGNDGEPGDVSLSGGSISAAAAGYDFSINTATSGSADAGSVTLAAFGLSGGHNVRHLSVTASSVGGASGVVTFASDATVAGAINVGGGTIYVNAVVQSSNNPILFFAAAGIVFGGFTGRLDAGTGNATLTVVSGGSGGITSGEAALDISAASLALGAGAGGVGATDNPLTFDVSSVTAGTGGNGAMFLREANSLTVGGAGLNAGSSPIYLAGGTFSLGGPDRIADTSPIWVLPGAVLDLNGSGETIGSLSGGGNVTLGVATLTTGADNTHTTFSGVIAGAGGLAKIGTGSFYLRGTNTYDGTTTIQNGSVLASVNNALGSVAGGTRVEAGLSARLVFDSAVNYTTQEQVTINGSGFNGIGSLAGVGNVTFAGSVLLESPGTIGAYVPGATFTLSGSVDTSGHALTVKGTGNMAVSGTITGAGPVIKEGGVTLILSGLNTYSGNTTVQSGVLAVNGSNATSETTLLSTSTLAGTGAVGAIVANGGTVSPGNGIGVLTGSAGNFSGGGILRMQIQSYGMAGTDFDRLNLGSGILTTGGTSQLSLDLSGLSTTGTASGIVLYGIHPGTFSSVELLNNPNGYSVCLSYGDLSLDVTIQNGACGVWSSPASDGPAVAVRDVLPPARRGWAARSRAITVAHLDTGVDYSHPDLYRNIWLNEAEIPPYVRSRLRDHDADRRITLRDLNRHGNTGDSLITDRNGNGFIDSADVLREWSNGVDEDRNGYVDDLIGWDFVNNDNDPMDDSGHGTHGAGIVAQIAPRAEIMPLKFLDLNATGSLADARRAFDYALAHGVPLSNNGWSASVYAPEWLGGLSQAAAMRHLVVTAAGNGDPALLDVVRRSHLSNVLVATATDAAGALAPFSNWDPGTVDLALPGVRILSTLPGGQFAARSGTSVATAMATGFAALLMSRHPQWSREQIVDEVIGELKPSLSATTAPTERAAPGVVSFVADTRNTHQKSANVYDTETERADAAITAHVRSAKGKTIRRSPR